MSLIQNPIAYAHFQNQGGWKRAGLFSGVIALAVVLLVSGSVQLSSSRSSVVLDAWLAFLTGGHALLLATFGCGRINAAVRFDLTSGMMESHRLMPTGPASAILGYFLGGAGIMLSISAALMACGAVICFAAGSPVDRWLFTNALFYMYAILFASIQIYVTLSLQAGASGAGAVIWGATFLLGYAAVMSLSRVLPPLGMLIFPFTRSIRGSDYDAPGMACALVMIGALAGIFFMGCCRNFARWDRPGMGMPLGFSLLVLWAVATVAVVRYPETFPDPGFGGSRSVGADAKTPACLLGMLVLALPMASAAGRGLARALRAGRSGAGGGIAKVILVLGGAIGLAYLLSNQIAWGAIRDEGTSGWDFQTLAQTLPASQAVPAAPAVPAVMEPSFVNAIQLSILIFAANLGTCIALIAAFDLLGFKRPMATTVLIAAVIWIAPMIIELSSLGSLGAISAFGAPGALVEGWQSEKNVNAGVIFQWLLFGGAVFWMMALARRRRAADLKFEI